VFGSVCHSRGRTSVPLTLMNEAEHCLMVKTTLDGN
jgi:hypothetical protein